MATITGTEGNDILTDTPQGDTINALGGDDQITVTAGGDTVNGGTGDDRLIGDFTAQGDVAVNTVVGPTANTTEGGFNGQINNGNGALLARFTSIEHFTITTGTGAGADNIVTASGNDVISTNGGNDLVDVGRGVDTADGGAGVDRLSADFSDDTQGVSIDLRNATNAGAFGSFSNFEHYGTITGSAFNDSFLGATPAGVNISSTFNLGAGDDTAVAFRQTDVNGGTGSDRLIGDFTAQGDVSVLIATGPTANTTDGGFNGQFNSGNGVLLARFTSIESFTITTGTGLGADIITTASGNDVVNTNGADDLVDVGRGVDTADGGAGVDRLSADFSDDTAGGTLDTLGLRGDYAGANAVVFDAATMINVEGLALISGRDTRFGRENGQNYSYDITFNDGNVAAGSTFIVDAGTLTGVETARFDGSRETNGRFDIFGGDGADVLIGGQGADMLRGNVGADRLTGGGGADMFRYQAVAESASASFDTITDFLSGTDRIDLSLIDANTRVDGNDAFTYIDNRAFSGAGGELRAVTDGTGTRVEGDTDGDGVADFVIVLLDVVAPLPGSDFVL